MYLADFSPPPSMPAQTALSNANPGGTVNPLNPDASCLSAFSLLLTQKGTDGTQLQALAPTLPTLETASDPTLPQQELAALFLFSPQLPPQSMQILSPAASTLSPTEAVLPNPLPSNPSAPLLSQADANPAPVLPQMDKAQIPIQAQPAGDSFSTQAQLPKHEILTQPLLQDADTDVLSQGSSTASKPLFQAVDSIPVKVGDMPSLDTQAADFPQKLGTELSKALLQGEQTLSLRLAPAELGTVTVEMTRLHDGSLQVLLKTTNLAATNLLQDRAADLSVLLRGSNQNPVYVEVQQTDSSQYQQQSQQQGHGQQHSQSQQQGSHARQQSQDFLEQLRLGLVSLNGEST